MCTIAGYAGHRRAAPILIEMMRKEEFMDGGPSTGIATIHDGKLYKREDRQGTKHTQILA